MAISFDSDRTPDLRGIPATGSLLSSDDQLAAGIRVTRAQFAKMMGCSRQAVTDWVRAGRLTVGSDGRFDPRKAVADLLRTGDPARLRAKVLQPLADEVARYRARIVYLESALAVAQGSLEQNRGDASDLQQLRDAVDFHEGAANELIEIFEALKVELASNWPALAQLAEEQGARIVIGWLDRCLEAGPMAVGPMAGRAGGEEEGEGEVNYNQSEGRGDE